MWSWPRAHTRTNVAERSRRNPTAGKFPLSNYQRYATTIE